LWRLGDFTREVYHIRAESGGIGGQLSPECRAGAGAVAGQPDTELVIAYHDHSGPGCVATGFLSC
jgi:hypothetical protein